MSSLLVALLTDTAHACVLTVTGPSGTFDQGDAVSVTWTPSAGCSADVNVRVYETVTGTDIDPLVAPIEAPGANDGQVDDVGLDAALFEPGEYHVCVSEAGPIAAPAGDCGAPFTVVEPCALAVTAPTGTWVQGDAVTLRWTTSGSCSAQIDARVYETVTGTDTDPLVSAVEAPGPNDREIGGIGLDAALFSPGRYHFCVGESGVDEPAGDCGPSIDVLEAPCAIEVTGPSGVFDHADAVAITWSWTGDCSESVDARLFDTIAGTDADPVISAVEAPGPNDGRIDGVVLDPALIPAGLVHVCVGESGVAEPAGDCGAPFTVVAAEPAVVPEPEWVGETIPDGTTLAPGSAFEKEFLLRNPGPAAWSDGISLVRVSGSLGRSGRVDVGEPVAAGAVVSLRVPSVAPVVPGLYREEWRPEVGGIALAVHGPGDAWQTPLIWTSIAVSAPATPPDDLAVVDAGNPTPAEVDLEIARLAEQHGFAPAVLEAILVLEGPPGAPWTQYRTDDGAAVYTACGLSFPYDPGDPVYGYDVDPATCVVDSVGIGLAQVTLPVDDTPVAGAPIPFEDGQQALELGRSWRANLARAAEIAMEKWALNVVGATGCDADPRVLENWWWAVAWYNGSGDAAYEYVSAWEDVIRGSADVDPAVAPHLDAVGDLGSPTVLAAFPSTVTEDVPPGGFYALADLVAAGVRIHRYEGGVYVDITDAVASGACAASPPPSERPPGRPAPPKAEGTPSGVTLSFPFPEDADRVEVVDATDGAVLDGDAVAPWFGAFPAAETVGLALVACNDAGCSPPSDAVWVTVEALSAPAVVTGLVASVDGGQVIATWPVVGGADEYRVRIVDPLGAAAYASVTAPPYTASTWPADAGIYTIAVQACAVEDLGDTYGPPLSVCGAWSSDVVVSLSSEVDGCQALPMNVILRGVTVARGAVVQYCVEIPDGAEILTVQMGGKGLGADPFDVDLGVRHGAPLSTADFQTMVDTVDTVVPWEAGSIETVTVRAPAAGLWFLALYGSDDLAQVPGQAVGVDLRVHAHTSRGEGLPVGFALRDDAVSTIVAPLDATVSPWWNPEGWCSTTDQTFWGGCADPVDDGTIIEDACFTECISPDHIRGDAGAVDWNCGGGPTGVACSGPERGAPVYSMLGGVVLHASVNSGYGNNVIVQSWVDGNFAERAAHCDSIAEGVVEGAFLEPGDPICAVGGSGGVPVHLHSALYGGLASNAASGGAIRPAALWTLRTGANPDRSQARRLPYSLDEYLATPARETGTYAEARCPVTLEVVDGDGESAGPNGFGGIRGAADVELLTLHLPGEDVAVVTAPSTAQLRVHGVRAGSADVVLARPGEGHVLSWLDRPIGDGVVAHATPDHTRMAHGDLGAAWTSEASTDSVHDLPALRLDPPVSGPVGVESVLVLTGVGFGTADPPGEVELVRGSDAWRPFAVRSWTDERIELELEPVGVEPGSYQLRVVRYPDRAVSRRVAVDVVAGDEVLALSGLDRRFVLAGVAGDVVTAVGSGFAEGAALVIGGVGRIDPDRVEARALMARLPSLSAGVHRVRVTLPDGRASPELVRLLALDPVADADGDGLTNEEELSGGTAPHVADTDGDGTDDGTDAFPADPRHASDTDGDGIDDETDPTPLGGETLLSLVVQDLVAGASGEALVAAAPPGATVHLFGSRVGPGPGPCLGPAAATCVPLRDPVRLGLATADAGGSAAIHFTAPPGPLWLWAGRIAPPMASPVVAVRVVVPEPADTGEVPHGGTGDTGAPAAATCDGLPDLLAGVEPLRQTEDLDNATPYVLGMAVEPALLYDQVIYRTGPLSTDALRFCVTWELLGSTSAYVRTAIIEDQPDWDLRWAVEGWADPGLHEDCQEVPPSELPAFLVTQVSAVRFWSLPDGYVVHDARLCEP